MDFVISHAKLKDIDEIKNINETCLPENYSIKVFQQLYPSTLVCREKGKEKIIGYLIMANLVTNDVALEPFSRIINNKLVHSVIFSLAVLPDYRKKGVASMLLKIACNIKQKYPIILHVRKSNLAAFKLYTKFGFKELKEIVNYYQNPDENGLIMIYA